MYSHAVIKLHTHTCLDKDSQWERFLNIGWKLGDKLKPWITAHIPNCRFFFHLSTFLHSNLDIIGKRGKANFPSQVCAMYVFRFKENVKYVRGELPITSEGFFIPFSFSIVSLVLFRMEFPDVRFLSWHFLTSDT